MPIYNAFNVTRNAIQSLIQHNHYDDVLLINDASTDARIVGLFHQLPTSWQVIHNEQNLKIFLS